MVKPEEITLRMTLSSFTTNLHNIILLFPFVVVVIPRVSSLQLHTLIYVCTSDTFLHNKNNDQGIILCDPFLFIYHHFHVYMEKGCTLELTKRLNVHPNNTTFSLTVVQNFSKGHKTTVLAAQSMHTHLDMVTSKTERE